MTMPTCPSRTGRDARARAADPQPRASRRSMLTSTAGGTQRADGGETRRAGSVHEVEDPVDDGAGAAGDAAVLVEELARVGVGVVAQRGGDGGELAARVRHLVGRLARAPGWRRRGPGWPSSSRPRAPRRRRRRAAPPSPRRRGPRASTACAATGRRRACWSCRSCTVHSTSASPPVPSLVCRALSARRGMPLVVDARLDPPDLRPPGVGQPVGRVAYGSIASTNARPERLVAGDRAGAQQRLVLPGARRASRSSARYDASVRTSGPLRPSGRSLVSTSSGGSGLGAPRAAIAASATAFA